jgi:hypothetical protein
MKILLKESLLCIFHIIHCRRNHILVATIILTVQGCLTHSICISCHNIVATISYNARAAMILMLQGVRSLPLLFVTLNVSYISVKFSCAH